MYVEFLVCKLTHSKIMFEYNTQYTSYRTESYTLLETACKIRENIKWVLVIPIPESGTPDISNFRTKYRKLIEKTF